MLGDLSAPDLPSTPFGNPQLIILDVIRTVFIFLPALINVFIIPYVVATRELPRGQRRRFFALGALSAAAFGTELDHFGDYANYRILLHAIGCSLAAWGVFRMLADSKSHSSARHSRTV